MVSSPPKIVSRTLQRVGPGVHRHRVLRRAGDAEVVRGDAVADDQVVVADPDPVVTDDLTGLVIDADDRGAAKPDACRAGR